MSKKPTKDAFIAEALLIDTKPTAYNTRFRTGALQQVADKINNDGLPLLLVHDSSKLPVGAWYEAKVNEKPAVLTKFYIPKEIREYEDIKTRVETEILDSVSIGFRANKHDCSICGNDIQDYENCPHIPGREYEIKDKESGASLGMETCYVMLDDIQASEASLVYSGAVPDAKIVEFSDEDKKEYFTANKLNFNETIQETVQMQLTLHNSDETKIEGDQKMEEEYKELDEKYQALRSDLNDIKSKYQDAREDIIKFKEEILDYKEKLTSFETLSTEVEELRTTYSDTVQKLTDKAEALAAPFDENYEAPKDLSELLADIDKFIEQAKTLPSGQQSQTEPELTYVEPDSMFKV